MYQPDTRTTDPAWWRGDLPEVADVPAPQTVPAPEQPLLPGFEAVEAEQAVTPAEPAAPARGLLDLNLWYGTTLLLAVVLAVVMIITAV